MNQSFLSMDIFLTFRIRSQVLKLAGLMGSVEEKGSAINHYYSSVVRLYTEFLESGSSKNIRKPVTLLDWRWMNPKYVYIFHLENY